MIFIQQSRTSPHATQNIHQTVAKDGVQYEDQASLITKHLAQMMGGDSALQINHKEAAMGGLRRTMIKGLPMSWYISMTVIVLTC